MSRLGDILRERSRELDKLGEKSRVPVERLRALMGGAEPSTAELRRIADALGRPVIDFLPASGFERQADILLRRASGVGRRAPSEIVSSLSRKMAYSFDLLGAAHEQARPSWFEHFIHDVNTYESAEHNAVIFRQLFCENDQLGPLLLLPKLSAERMGLLAFVINSAELDGASAFFGGIPFAFIAARFKGRMLFTLAHEIGHLIAHHDPSRSFAVLDQTDRTENPGASASIVERYAHAFASALLMPRSSVGIVLEKVRSAANIRSDELGDLEIAYLARIFGVSFLAGARRCEDLGLLPRGGATSLNDELARRYGSAERRADRAGLPARPEIEFPPVPRPLLDSAVRKIRAGEISIGRASAILGLSFSDILAANISAAH